MSPTVSEAHLPELQHPLSDRYQVQEVLSARLWVRTYRAQDLHHPKQATCVIRHIKAMPTIVPNYHDVMRGLLANEAMILAQVSSHPQIPYQLDFFEDEHGFYLVQEEVTGRAFTEELRSQPEWGVDAVLNLLRELAEPLAWVHRFGGMHGNLKPDNILHRETDGRLVLIDFHGMDGLQRAVMAAHGIDVPPQVAAQQGYQPLEQLQGLPCAASDVYALGMIAVQAWTGMDPVDFQMDPETAAILWQAHVPPSHHPLHAGLMQILENMVQWDLPQRYANADQILLALNDLQPGLGGTVATPDRPTAATPLPASTLPALKPRIAQVTPHPAISQAMLKASSAGRSPSHLPVVDAEVIAVTAPPAVAAARSSGATVGMKSWLEQTLTSPSLRVGAGGMAVATTFAAVGWGLLNSVDWSVQPGTLLSRFVPASDNEPSPKYRTVKTLTEQWRQDWQQATRTLQQAEMAMQQREWSKARQLAMTMPDIPYWRDRGAALVQEVSTQASTDATLRLQEAFDLAQGRQFTKALALLDTMAQEPDNPLLATIQAKQKEYREKENIKAWFDLQQAYDHAIQQNFGRALDFLYQIPPRSTAYVTAQVKVTEYQEKLRIQAANPVVSAVPATNPAIALTPMSSVEPSVTQVPVSAHLTPTHEQAQLQQQTQLATTLATLETSAGMPQGSDAQDQAIAQRIQLQRQALNQQSAIWLHKAEQQVQAGQLEAAIATLSHVPLGTTAYAQARDRIQTLTAQLQAPPQPTTVATQRQPQPLIIGRATLRQIP